MKAIHMIEALDLEKVVDHEMTKWVMKKETRFIFKRPGKVGLIFKSTSFFAQINPENEYQIVWKASDTITDREIKVLLDDKHA